MLAQIPALGNCLWRKQMVDPATNSLLVLYDDAQSICERSRSKQFSFKSVGIQAQGRTTILKPVSCGRDGTTSTYGPLSIRLPSLRAEATRVAFLLGAVHWSGHAWGDMAIIWRHYSEMDECAGVLRQRGLPHQVKRGAGSFDPAADTIKVLTMHASKGLGFPVVALVGAGHMPAPGEDEREETKLFYVGATRATQRLIIGLGGKGQFAERFAA
jgi:superfamily I DNA/RNA helicase